jgi:predicted ribosome quality control (RQC) complex YloA/Tae2 family protein
MLTDWVLIRRLAHELKERLQGARVEDAGLLPDGRIALSFRQRGARPLLAIDLFASPPLVTLEEGELGIGVEPGFIRTVARSLRGMTLADASARRHDRLLRLTFAARSRFGVGEELQLYLELVPRFGNAVLVKDGVVIAAGKEFPPSENPRRPIHAGAPYLLPPLPERARTLATVVADEDAAEPLFVYRRDGELQQAYVVPLEGFDDLMPTRENSLLVLFAELREQQAARAGNQRVVARRVALFKQLDERERKLRGELAALNEKRRHAQQREALRTQGEDIFATLHSLPEEQRDEAKDRAAKLFAAYKKLAKSLPHVEVRERTIGAGLEVIDTLRWESERAGDEDLDAVETALSQFGPQRGARRPERTSKRKRPALELRTPSGSRILVGRSPLENADLTFRVARPNDLWFHTRGVPGAHVILARDDRTPAPEEDLQRAASLAAFYSRGKGSASVPVDYTLRKHVRKQRAAPPGLVWYTDAKTILAQPRSIDELRATADHPSSLDSARDDTGSR